MKYRIQLKFYMRNDPLFANLSVVTVTVTFHEYSNNLHCLVTNMVNLRDACHVLFKFLEPCMTR